MRDGFVKVAAVTPRIRVADCDYNTEQIIRLLKGAWQDGAKIIVFPELAVTAYTCNDLFLQERLLRKARECLKKIADATAGRKALVFVGLPFEVNGKLYNVAAALSDGLLLGLVPKRYLPNYNEYYEARYFHPGEERIIPVWFDGYEVPFGMNQLFVCRPVEKDGSRPVCGADAMKELRVAAEICEDMWAPLPPSTCHALAGANVIVNLSASVDVAGKSEYRRTLVTGQAGRLICGYIYASSGDGESSQDLVFGGHRMISENGKILADSGRFSTGITCSELDIDRLRAERRRMTTYPSRFAAALTRRPQAMRRNPAFGQPEEEEAAENRTGLWNPAALPLAEIPGDLPDHAYVATEFELEIEETELTRAYSARPFVPANDRERAERCEEILAIQALGLKKRIEHVKPESIVVGISGGLDSTLALLVMVRAYDLMGLDRKGIIAVTMPAFGTTSRTHDNAVRMVKQLGCTLREIDIREAVQVHFRDIGHDPSVTDVTYENSQARERTQILMDIANQKRGFVVGTGDMSELALGWATYNGDHMSMYGVNCSLPKTLVRHLVSYYADTCGDGELGAVLRDVLSTPVSPELLPPKDGEIAQITEDLVGPYELHDFFLYHVLRFGSAPLKVLRLAEYVFAGTYDRAFILKWLKTFYWRFFTQQYKRSCVPDGPKVGSVALSPRGDLRMPSDAVVKVWREELDGLS